MRYVIKRALFPYVLMVLLLLILVSAKLIKIPAPDSTAIKAITATKVQQERATRFHAIPGLKGALKIHMSVAKDCIGTLVLIDKAGQTLRILAQVVPLQAGIYEIPWDGMDLWGNLVPADTQLTLKLITNPGIKAIYEMSVGSSGNPVWLTGRTGEGDAMRQGGNLGDHSGPGTVAAVGNKLFFGSFCVEHGHNLIATTLAGEKMWGIQIEGWNGPNHLTSDGKTLFVVTRDHRNVYSVDPSTFNVRKLFETTPDDVQAIAAKDNQLTFILKNHAANQDPFRRTRFDIDFANSVPSIPAQDKLSPYSGQINSQEQYSTVFRKGGHIQTGFNATTLNKNSAFAIVAFNKPTTIGSLLLQKIPGVESADFYFLKPGVALNHDKHVPKPGVDDDLDEDWIKLGTTMFEHMVEVIPSPKADLTTQALYLRLNISPNAEKLTAGRIAMCRIEELRVNRVDADIKVIVPVDALAVPENKRIVPGCGQSVGWDFKTGSPINDLNPVTITLDLGKTTTFAGLSLQNCANPEVEISALDPKADLATATGKQWTLVTRDRAESNKFILELSSHPNANDRQIDFPEVVTTRALRLKFLTGIGAGRNTGGGQSALLAEDAQRVACADVILLGLLDKLPNVPSHLVEVRDTSGKVLFSSFQYKFPLRQIAYDVSGDGTLYGITDSALVKVTLSGNDVKLQPLAQGLKNPNSIAIEKDRIAVAETSTYSIHLFDKTGRKLNSLGGKGPYRRGLYDPTIVNEPDNVSIASDGNIWFVESTLHPKRIAQFSAEGKHLQDLWGPPEYGGGGYLDPNLQSFYYRGMEFGIDFAKGTWAMKAFNDRFGSQETPTSGKDPFTYTHVGRPIVYKGRKYAVGDNMQYAGGGNGIVSLLENNMWKPAVVMGGANHNGFLIDKQVWRAYWLKQNLENKGFIWCDRNGDGQYQVNEVELYDLAGKGLIGGSFWGGKMGADLTMFTTTARLAPSSFTDRGVPLYEAKNIQRYKVSELAPYYRGNELIGALAHKGYGNSSIVAADGSLVLEAQPYRIGLDLQIVGSPLTARPSDYLPPIQGLILDNPLGFSGIAQTKSPLGEIAIMIGDNGPWFLWSVKYNCIVARIFTGTKGGWSSVPNVRGTDVTENNQDWECFFGNFIKADNGNYYTVAGHGHHAISRIDGLDSFALSDIPITVTPGSFAANTQLRSMLIDEINATETAKKANKEMVAPALSKRTKMFKLDGELKDWGSTKDMTPLNDQNPGAVDKSIHMLHVAAATDDNGLYIAYSGVGVLKNSADDPKFIFKSGFCLEFAFRSDPRANKSGGRLPARVKGGDLVAGDKRILIAPFKGKWIAMLFDYVDPNLPEDNYLDYASPVLTTKIAHVIVLPDNQVKIAVRSDYDAERKPPQGMKDFTAEVFLSWKALSLAQPAGASLLCDFAVLSADAGGTAVERRWYWSNPDTDAITDMAVEAAIRPSTFGTLHFEK